MKKDNLEALIHLFSIISVYYKDLDKEEALNFIEVFLDTEYHLENVSGYSQTILSCINKYQSIINKEDTLLEELCCNIKINLPKKMRVLILIHVLQFIKFSGNVHFNLFKENKEQKAVKIIANEFNIDGSEYINCAAFISNMLHKVENKERLLIISKPSVLPDKIGFIERKELNGKIVFLFIKSVNLHLFTYDGETELFINNKPLYNRYLYVFSHNTVINSSNIAEIHYDEILTGFSKIKNDIPKIVLEAREISYTFKNSLNGINKFSLQAKSFQFIGVMGGSGSGKTTLLNLLNGSIKPDKGDILINGKHFLNHHKELKSLIGYVPQDDSLIEELTVYENLYYFAKFCYGKYTEKEIDDKVNNLLIELDLIEIKDLKIGSLLKKMISGGQRKRLNIALELIREPYILLVDEPTSGLSSTDAEKITYLLADQANKGCLVITNIHQPSSEIFKLFDSIIILDRGGYPIYSGVPTNAFDYFREKTGNIDIYKGFTKQGYFIPDEIFRFIEDKKLNEYGEHTSERIHTPEEWFKYYQQTTKIPEQITNEFEIPATSFKTPGKLKQTFIYFKRNFQTKIGDKQYLLIALFIAPILAVILGYFTKNTVIDQDGGYNYSLSTNENMPSFFFMSVIVSLFIGLIVSAEEIIDDRKLIKRESFLNLSRASYLHSKILSLVLLGFIQTLLYTFLSVSILEIPDIGAKMFFILFSLSCFANILGLVISSSLNSVVSVYISIPLILIPQLFLSGIVVNFDNLHYSISSNKYVPFMGDLMASRWGIEALMVEQFKNNEYEKIFYPIENKISDYSFIQYHVIPILNNNLSDCFDNCSNSEKKVIHSGFNQIAYNTNIKIPEFNRFDDTTAVTSALNFIKKCKDYLGMEINSLIDQKDNLMKSSILKIGSKETFMLFKNKHYNESIARIVKHEDVYSKQVLINNEEIIRKNEPIFNTSDNNYGRSHFYAPSKALGNLRMDTFWFNSLVIWTMWLVFYIILLLNIPNIFNKLVKNFKFKTIHL